MEASLALDHLFVFVEPGAPERAALERAGLRESFRRRHPGQRTANVCFCFDNAYLELLWEGGPAGDRVSCRRPHPPRGAGGVAADGRVAVRRGGPLGPSRGAAAVRDVGLSPSLFA